MPDWLEKEVMNEVDTRRRNEWIEETNDSYGAREAVDDYACECSYAGCTTSIRLTRVEYEDVRADGTHFVIALNHENPTIGPERNSPIGLLQLLSRIPIGASGATTQRFTF